MDNKQVCTIGIVAEYNPLHNGHAWQIEQARLAYPNACIVAVMSGNFVQRGQPAVLDKWSRAKTAIQGGVDLVLELPFSFACRSAEYFATGAIGILDSLGIVDHLVFGSECAQLDELYQFAQTSLDPRTINSLKEYMKSGLSYTQALQSSLRPEIATSTALGPNNILGIEYLKQLILLKSPIQPKLILRQQAAYTDQDISGQIASATAIRRQLNINLDNKVAQALPATTLAALQQALATHQLILDNNCALSLLCLYKLRNSNPEYLREHTDVSEGLEYKILKNAAQYHKLSDLVNSLVNKRYTQSRISRILMQALMGMSKAKQATYIRPLAFNSRGRSALTKIKAAATLPLIAKLGRDLVNLPAQLQDCPVLKTEIDSGNLYQMLLASGSGVHNLDFLSSPYYIN